MSVISHTRHRTTINLPEVPPGSIPDVCAELPREPLSVDPYLYYDVPTVSNEPPQRSVPTWEYSNVADPWPQLLSMDDSHPESCESQSFRRPASTSRRLGILEINKIQIDALFRMSAFHLTLILN